MTSAGGASSPTITIMDKLVRTQTGGCWRCAEPVPPKTTWLAQVWEWNWNLGPQCRDKAACKARAKANPPAPYWQRLRSDPSFPNWPFFFLGRLGFLHDMKAHANHTPCRACPPPREPFPR